MADQTPHATIGAELFTALCEAPESIAWPCCACFAAVDLALPTAIVRSLLDLLVLRGKATFIDLAPMVQRGRNEEWLSYWTEGIASEEHATLKEWIASSKSTLRVYRRPGTQVAEELGRSLAQISLLAAIDLGVVKGRPGRLHALHALSVQALHSLATADVARSPIGATLLTAPAEPLRRHAEAMQSSPAWRFVRVERSTQLRVLFLLGLAVDEGGPWALHDFLDALCTRSLSERRGFVRRFLARLTMVLEEGAAAAPAFRSGVLRSWFGDTTFDIPGTEDLYDGYSAWWLWLSEAARQSPDAAFRTGILYSFADAARGVGIVRAMTDLIALNPTERELGIATERWRQTPVEQI
jgi:hypothetical protein